MSILLSDYFWREIEDYNLKHKPHRKFELFCMSNFQHFLRGYEKDHLRYILCCCVKVFWWPVFLVSSPSDGRLSCLKNWYISESIYFPWKAKWFGVHYLNRISFFKSVQLQRSTAQIYVPFVIKENFYYILLWVKTDKRIILKLWSNWKLVFLMRLSRFAGNVQKSNI